MQRIKQRDIPAGYRYYRSGFLAYAKYIDWLFPSSTRISSDDTGSYGWIHPVFTSFFSIAKFLKSPIIPNTELLRTQGMRHGIVYWSPWGKTTGSLEGWRQISPSKSLKQHHAGRSAFSVLDTPEYWTKWSPNARNHRKQIQKARANNLIMLREVSLDEWFDVYKKTPLSHRLKGYHMSVLRQLDTIPETQLRIMLAYVDDVPLAGAIFLDEAPTSVYFVAFQDPSAKPHHLGLALIDWWFADSLAKGYKYLDFDHMWSPGDPESYKGYTQFKSELADYEMEFDEVWWKFF